MKKLLAGATLATMLIGTGYAALANDDQANLVAQVQPPPADGISCADMTFVPPEVEAANSTAVSTNTVTDATTPAAETAALAATSEPHIVAEGTTPEPPVANLVMAPAETAVLGVTEVNAELPAVTVTPDNFLYRFKLLAEQLRLAVTLDTTIKAELLDDLAQLRLAEAKVMVEAGDLELAYKALANAHAKLVAAEQAIAAAAEANKDLTALSEQIAISQVNITNILIMVVDVAPVEIRADIEAVVAELLVQLAETTDAANQDDTAKNEAEHWIEADVTLTAEWKAKLKSMPPRKLLVLKQMAKAADKPFAEVYAMYLENPGLGNIAKALDLKMGPVQHAAQLEWKHATEKGILTVELEGKNTVIEKNLFVTANVDRPAPVVAGASLTAVATVNIKAPTARLTAVHVDADIVKPAPVIVKAAVPAFIEYNVKAKQKDQSDWKRRDDDDRSKGKVEYKVDYKSEYKSHEKDDDKEHVKVQSKSQYKSQEKDQGRDHDKVQYKSQYKSQENGHGKGQSKEQHKVQYKSHSKGN